MQKDAAVLDAAARFERVEWLYDGLKGKIIPWTKANGGTSDDPSVQAFVVDLDGKVVERATDADAHQPKAFVRWLTKHADAWEKAHPKTKVAFVPAEIVAEGEGAERTVKCAALDDARAAGTPVAVYVGRGPRTDDDAKAKAEAAASRAFEKGTLNSDDAAKAASGWTLLRLDRGDKDQAALAKSLGVEEAPALLLFAPGAEKPQALPRDATGASLAFQMKKTATAPK